MATQLATNGRRVVHVRFAGQSFDVPLDSLDVNDRATDRQVRDALARQLEVNASRLADHVLDRHANGNLTLRPEAVYG